MLSNFSLWQEWVANVHESVEFIRLEKDQTLNCDSKAKFLKDLWRTQGELHLAGQHTDTYHFHTNHWRKMHNNDSNFKKFLFDS